MSSHALQRVEKWDKSPESRSDDSVLTHRPVCGENASHCHVSAQARRQKQLPIAYELGISPSDPQAEPPEHPTPQPQSGGT